MGFLDKIFRPLTRSEPWGVHPDERKRPASETPIRRLPPPPLLYLPLSQHVGAAAEPIVRIGQKVLKGECVATAKGNISAPVHAPTSGEIVAIGPITAPHPSRLEMMAITLRSDMEDRWAPLEGLADPLARAPEELARRVAEAGIVGLGGATFPASVKLGLGHRSRIRTLILNGSECEPYLSCDDRLMRERAGGVIRGAVLMRHATGAREVRIGIEDNKPEAIAAMRAAVDGHADVQVCVVPARYPMGSDRQLIIELTGIEVPAESRAADVGVLVHNVGTAFAIHQAIDLGRPLVSRLMTLNGEALAQPGNYEVLVGTLVEDLLAFAGGVRGEPARLVMGGPMMGLLLPSAKVPVVKGCSGILALSATEVARDEPGPCIRCGSCTRACPVGLLPLEMNARIANAALDAAVALGLHDCIGCGCCAWVCPSRIPLVQAFNHAKGELAAHERDKKRTDATRRMAEARSERLEREAREKAEAAARRAAERKAQKAREAAESAASNSEGAPA
ncbi:electron transport complex subunit RsxC [Aromatoleum toluclasticum]|uniref:electron transport complex subunit RsxC n=1 Tax=Aromatoleum toluclasticum TaxID=92003 RepID=UPI0003820730|nr:electron transport complex subunit RsxC [Aromatoleum toluclasticum]